MQALAGLRGELLSWQKFEFGTWEVRPRCAALFGSAARGDGDRNSDIDLLLLHSKGADDEPEIWQRQLAGLRTLVKVWTGNDGQFYDIHEHEILRMIAGLDPLLAEWRSDAVTLAGIASKARQAVKWAGVVEHLVAPYW